MVGKNDQNVFFSSSSPGTKTETNKNELQRRGHGRDTKKLTNFSLFTSEIDFSFDLHDI
jgi:hypothetical protein